MSEPWDGRPGVASDGTPVVWVASLGRGLPISQAKAMGVQVRQQPPSAGGVNGFDMSAADPKFAQRMATERAAMDVKRLSAASDGVREGFSNEQNALGAEALLKSDTPTGPFAKQRIGAGRALGGFLGGVVPGIPTQAQTTNLEQLQTLANQGTLGNVGQLKGPMSDRDVMFLKTLQYDPNATKAHNFQVVEAQKWASARQAAYGSALRAWTKVLGSPSALNANGLDFDRWWGQYSEQHLPRPGTTPVNPRAQANDALKAKSAQAKGQPVFLGYEQ